MFNNKNDSTSSGSITTNTKSQLDTMLGKNTSIKGDIEFNGALILDGSIYGCVKGSENDDVLTISETGVVEGKIEVANIIINGLVKGDIIASGKIEVASKANIEGNVYYQNIEMETGSKINGQLIYQEGNKAGKISNIDSKKAK